MKRLGAVCWSLGTLLALVGVPLLVLPGLNLTPGQGWGSRLPLWLILGAEDPVDVPKALLVTIATACLMVGLLGREVSRPDRRQQLAAALTAALLAWMALGVGHSALPGWGWPAWWTALSLAVLLGLWTVGCTADELRRMTLVLCGSAGIMGIYAVLQRCGWDPLSWAHPELTLSEWIGRPISTTGNPNFLANFEVTVLPLAFHELVRRRRPVRVFLGVVIGALLVSLALTQTRAAVMALLMAMVVWLVLLRPAARDGSSRIQPAAAAVLLALCVAVAFVVVLQRPVDPQEVNAGARVYLWKVAVRVAAAHPLFGCGLTLFPYAALAHRDIEPLSLRHRARLAEDPHDIVLSVAASSGVPALVLLLGLWGLSVWRGVEVRGQLDADSSLPGAAASLVAFWVNQLFIYPTAPASVAACLATALLWAAPSAPRVPVRNFWPLLGVLLLAGSVWLAAGTLRAEFLAKLGQELAHSAQWQPALGAMQEATASRWTGLPVQTHLVDDEAVLLSACFAETRLTAAALDGLRAYQRESALNPLDPYPCFEAGRLAAELVAVDSSYQTVAMSLEDQAVALDPYNPNFLQERGILHLRFGPVEAARSDLRASAQLYPDAEVYVWLARADQAAHDQPAARADAFRALQQDRNYAPAHEFLRNLGPRP